MDSKIAVGSSATASVRQNSRSESIELSTLNQSGVSAASLGTDNTVVEDGDGAASRREMIGLAAVCWTQFMVSFKLHRAKFN